MPFQASRSAWSVIGWVTISPPKINSEISKILALNFRDVQNFNKVPGTPKFPKFQDSQKFQSFPYVLEKSRPLGLGIFEILEISRIFGIFEISEILDFLEIPKFPKSQPLCFGKIPSTRSGDLEILEFWNFWSFWSFWKSWKF